MSAPRQLLCALLLLGCLALPGQALASVRRFAVLVGNNEGAPGMNTLYFAEEDVLKMQTVLTTVGGYEEGDVRVLCNLVPDEYWMNTLLHELGHGVYDTYLDPELPWLLREPAHTLMTEAVAMIMGRLTKEEYWLRNVAGIPAGDLASVLPHIDEYARLTMLIFVRWCLVMIYFERDLYANPDQDLNTLWWDYVEQFQMLTRPAIRDAPDWAAVIHVALAPVYYHNYLLGEMLASQMGAYVRANVNEHGVVGSEKVGAFFREGLFDLGNRYPWDATIEKLTGEPLTPTHFARQFVE